MVTSVILQKILGWVTLVSEAVLGERDVRSVGKIENLNLVAHIYLYLFIEIFK